MRTQSINNPFNFPASQVTTDDFWIFGNPVHDTAEIKSVKLSNDSGIRKSEAQEYTKQQKESIAKPNYLHFQFS